MGVHGVLFWLDGGKWGWVGHYFGWMGVSGGGWGIILCEWK